MIPCPACKTELDPKTDRSPRDGRFVCWKCGAHPKQAIDRDEYVSGPANLPTPALDNLQNKAMTDAFNAIVYTYTVSCNGCRNPFSFVFEPHNPSPSFCPACEANRAGKVVIV
jgi:recombinational DNA repair protein (RecF pathway)